MKKEIVIFMIRVMSEKEHPRRKDEKNLSAPMTNRWGSTANAIHDRRQREEKKKEGEDFPKYKKNILFNMFHQSNRSCERPREKGKTLLNFGRVQIETLIPL